MLSFGALGEPTCDVGLMIRVLPLGHWHSRSNRKLEQALTVCLDFRLFCGRSARVRCPDHSTIYRFHRHRLNERWGLASILSWLRCMVLLCLSFCLPHCICLHVALRNNSASRSGKDDRKLARAIARGSIRFALIMRHYLGLATTCAILGKTGTGITTAVCPSRLPTACD